MIQEAKDFHIVYGRKKDGTYGQKLTRVAGEAQSTFDSWLSIKDATDMDGDSDTTETAFAWLVWYGQGRLIKYRNLQ